MALPRIYDYYSHICETSTVARLLDPCGHTGARRRPGMSCASRDRFAAAAARPTRQTLGNAPIRTVQLVATAGLLESARIMLDLLSFAVLPGLLLAAGALLSHFGGAIFAALVPLAPYLATGLTAAVAWRFRQTQ